MSDAPKKPRKLKAPQQMDIVSAIDADHGTVTAGALFEVTICDLKQIEILTNGVWDSVRKHAKGDVVTSPDADALVSSGHARFI